jgi:hypothetical protein
MRTASDQIDYTIELDGDEIEITAEYTYYPGCKGKMYMRNGDPGYPDEPPEAEIYLVYRQGDATKTNLIDRISEQDYLLLEQQVFEQEAESAYEAERDYDYE